MALKIIEFFGLAPLDPAAAADVAASRCPFIGDDCVKPNHGACSVSQIQPDPIICCPNRLYAENYVILSDIAKEAFGPNIALFRAHEIPSRIANGQMTGSEVVVFGRYWGSELPLPRPPGAGPQAARNYYMDWILAKVGIDGALHELTAVEVQTIDRSEERRVGKECR